MVEDFLGHREASQLLVPLMRQMLLLEMEGKFSIRRPRHATDVLNRVDKYLDFNLAQLEGNEHLALLKQTAKM